MGGHIVDPLLAEEEIAALNGVEARDHAKQGGLAAAGGAQQGEKFTFLDIQGNAVQGGKITVALYRVPDDDFIAHN